MPSRDVQPPAARFPARLDALGEDHRRGIVRFAARLDAFVAAGHLSARQADVVREHLLRLGERQRNPANTGNIEDLFCHTLADTGDAVRAYAQALADSLKVVPMDDGAPLRPRLMRLSDGRLYDRVGDLDHLGPGDRMLVAHTMAAYGDPEMWASAAAMVRVTLPGLDEAGVEVEVARMAVQSQHLPSSTFVLARAAGLTLECAPLYRQAGHGEAVIADAQRFYDICGTFEPAWSGEFLEGRIPAGEAWETWRGRYLEARARLPEALVYQLSSDTLTNFLDGTLESGKWTDASVFFGGVTDPAALPAALARIVNQYVAEHLALHDRPAVELTVACSSTLEPWGVTFEGDRAVPLPGPPAKAAELAAQFAAAWSRRRR